MVCGALFRPLEATAIKKKKVRELKELKSQPRGTIMNKIIEEKKRMRTISTGSLDGSVITRDNTLIRDPEKIKNIKNLTLARLDEVEEEDQHAQGTLPNGHSVSQTSVPHSTVNRLKEEARSLRPPAPLPPHTVEPIEKIVETNDNLTDLGSSESGKNLVTSTKSIAGMFPSRERGEPQMRARANSETRKHRKEYRISRTGEKVPLTDVTPKGSKLNLSPVEIKAREVARPMYR